MEHVFTRLKLSNICGMLCHQISDTSGCWPVAVRVSLVKDALALAKGLSSAATRECPFIKTSHCHQPNRVSWRNVCSAHHVKVCAICDHVAERLNCGAKKLIEYDYSTQVATVYHLGQHKCTPLLPRRVIPVQHPQIQLGQTLRGSAKEVGLRQIVSPYRCRRHGCSWEKKLKCGWTGGEWRGRWSQWTPSKEWTTTPLMPWA